MKSVETNIAFTPEYLHNDAYIKQLALQAAKLEDGYVRILKRSIDARGKKILYRCRVQITQDEPLLIQGQLPQWESVADKPRVIIIGAGPAGYFAALTLIEQGLKPIILERGKDVRDRRRDLRAIQQEGIVNPNSNYCFGEGGAGTYSDGKLYTRSGKRGSINTVLQLLVDHGASPEILVDAHPHIGSNKLPQVVSNIRETIINHGGEIHFNACVTDFELDKKGQIQGAIDHTGKCHTGSAYILATGHSARDIYHLIDAKNWRLESKPFALGVRVEHPQGLIDSIQYRQHPRHENLPASKYSLICQVEQRGVFSFCMCPGGLVVPSATAPGEIVINGMSMSKRDSPYANSGIVVQVELADLLPYQKFGAFSALTFQKEVEQTMFQAGDGSQQAPSQRMTDFVSGKVSMNLPSSSYIPGLFATRVDQLLPSRISKYLREAFKQYGAKMKGYYTNEANVIATESRTSSPIRIPRRPDTLNHPDQDSLFPCGEGAGYAGGIVSAAIDGQRVAQATAHYIQTT